MLPRLSLSRRTIALSVAITILAIPSLATQACSSDDADGQGAGQAGSAGANTGDAGTGGSTTSSAGAGGSDSSGGAAGSVASAGAGGAVGGDAGNQGGAGGPVGTGGTKSDPDPPTPTGEPTSGPLAGTLMRHNYVRQNVSPAAEPPIPDLVWSETIAASAQAYADQCVFEHSKGKYGENLWAGTGEPSGPKVVDSWASESANYDYAAGKCSGTCGHYTQVVWRKTTEVGCGYAKCSTNSPFGSSKTWYNWVCQYNPPGNYVGQKPY